MFSRETKKLSPPGPLVPLWDLLSILESWIQYKRWTSPYMCSTKLLVIRLGPCERFERSKACDPVRNPIKQPHCMLHRKRPETNVVGTVVWPMDCRMHHHVPRPIADCLNVSLSHSILVLCSHSREGLRLIFRQAIITEILGSVYSVITMIGFDIYTGNIPTHLLKSVLSHHCLACSHTRLTFDIDKIRSSVSENGTTV